MYSHYLRIFENIRVKILSCLVEDLRCGISLIMLMVGKTLLYELKESGYIIKNFELLWSDVKVGAGLVKNAYYYQN